MITLDKLIEKNHQENASKIAPLYRYLSKPGTDPAKEIAAIYAYFAKDESHLGLVVYQGKKKLGYIDRDTALLHIADLEKDLGTSEYSFLYGTPEDYYIVYRCAEPGCNQKIYSAYYDANEKFHCPDHQDSIMEKEK